MKRGVDARIVTPSGNCGVRQYAVVRGGELSNELDDGEIDERLGWLMEGEVAPSEDVGVHKLRRREEVFEGVW